MDQRTRKLMTKNKALCPRDYDDCMIQEKMERVDSPTFKIAAMHRYNDPDYIKTRGGRVITPTTNNTDNISINRAKITRRQE